MGGLHREEDVRVLRLGLVGLRREALQESERIGGMLVLPRHNDAHAGEHEVIDMPSECADKVFVQINVPRALLRRRVPQEALDLEGQLVPQALIAQLAERLIVGTQFLRHTVV